MDAFDNQPETAMLQRLLENGECCGAGILPTGTAAETFAELDARMQRLYVRAFKYRIRARRIAAALRDQGQADEGDDNRCPAFAIYCFDAHSRTVEG